MRAGIQAGYTGSVHFGATNNEIKGLVDIG